MNASTFPSKLLEGRLPDPQRPDEAVVNFLTSEQFGLKPGDTYTVGFFATCCENAKEGPAVTFRITGVTAMLCVGRLCRRDQKHGAG